MYQLAFGVQVIKREEKVLRTTLHELVGKSPCWISQEEMLQLFHIGRWTRQWCHFPFPRTVRVSRAVLRWRYPEWEGFAFSMVFYVWNSSLHVSPWSLAIIFKVT